MGVQNMCSATVTMSASHVAKRRNCCMHTWTKEEAAAVTEKEAPQKTSIIADHNKSNCCNLNTVLLLNVHDFAI